MTPFSYTVTVVASYHFSHLVPCNNRKLVVADYSFMFTGTSIMLKLTTAAFGIHQFVHLDLVNLNFRLVWKDKHTSFPTVLEVCKF